MSLLNFTKPIRVYLRTYNLQSVITKFRTKLNNGAELDKSAFIYFKHLNPTSFPKSDSYKVPFVECEHSGYFLGTFRQVIRTEVATWQYTVRGANSPVAI